MRQSMRDRIYDEHDDYLFLAENTESYQIAVDHQHTLRDMFKQLHVDTTCNEYGDLVISGHRIC